MKISLFSFFSFFFCLFSFLPLSGLRSPSLQAAAYYVDATGGNDSNDGLSPQEPWKTIAMVNKSKFKPGDNILFKRGEIWRETLVVPSSGAPGKPITFGAYGDGKRPIISAADYIMEWQENKNNIWSTLLIEKTNQVFFNKIRGKEVKNKTELDEENDWYFSSDTLYIFITKNPNIDTKSLEIEVSVRDNCVNLEEKSYLSFQNLEFTQSNSYHGGNIDSWENSGVYWRNIVIRDCEISYAFGHGIKIQTESSISILDSLIITRCIIHDNGDSEKDNGYGIKIVSGQNVNTNYQNIHISYNELYKNVQEAIRVECTNSTKIYNNNAHDNGFGISVDSGHLLFGSYTLNSEMYYNRCENSPAEAIWLGANDISNVKIYYNIINDVDNFQGMNISGVDGAEIYNNTIFNVNGGFAIGTDGKSTNIILTNNIVDSLNGLNGNIESGNLSTFKSDHNIWDESRPFYPEHVTRTWEYWTEELNQDSNGYYKDPEMINPENGNFALKTNSICINSGKNITVRFDIAGTSVPQGGKVDIGSLEYIQNMIAPKNLKVID